MHDLSAKLRRYAAEENTWSRDQEKIEDMLAAADEIERLRAGALGVIRPPITPASFDELEARVAMLESSARRTGYRIDAAAAAMKDVAARESIHPSVRYVADNLRLAFISTGGDEEVGGHG